MNNGRETQPAFARRDFLRAGLLAGAAIALAGCGDKQIPRKPRGIGQPDFEAAPNEPIAPSEPVPPSTPPSQMPPPLTRAELTTTPLFGPDTSRYQGVPLDPQRMIESDCAFWAMKATRGLPETQEFHQDPLYIESFKRARDSGLVPISYHFLNYDSPRDQVHRFAEFKEQAGSMAGTIDAVDVEESPPGTGGPDPDATHENVLEYVDEYHKVFPGKRLVIYTAQHYWGDTNTVGQLTPNNAPAPDGTELWNAKLLPDNPFGTIQSLAPQISAPFTKGDPWTHEQLGTWEYPLMRQITFNGDMAQFLPPGQNGATSIVDLNVSFFPLDRLRQLAAN